MHYCMDKLVPVHYEMARMRTALNKNICQYLHGGIALAVLDRQLSYAA